nr:blue copper protein [Quercus suber]
MAIRMGLIVCLIVGVALLNAATTQVTATVEYQVGESLGWTVPPNTSYYSTWASSKTFFLGDEFTFNATNGTHNVVTVSEAEYNACTKVTSSVFEVQNSSAMRYTPQTAGAYYIICTVGNHCEQGQKFSFKLQSTGSPTESLPNSASSLTVGALFAVLTTTAISFLTSYKSLGGRTRSPPRGKYGREEAGVELNWRKERSGQSRHDVVTGEGGDTVYNHSMKEGASSGQVQAPVAAYMQTAVEVSVANPRVVDEVEAENHGPVTDSMQTDAVLGAKRADVETQNTGVVISEPDIQLALNGGPNLNTWNKNEGKRANRNEVHVVSRSEEGIEHEPCNIQPTVEGAGLSNFKPKSTWTRFNRMEFGLGGLARAITLPTLGKRNLRDDVDEQVDGNEHKRGKVED